MQRARRSQTAHQPRTGVPSGAQRAAGLLLPLLLGLGLLCGGCELFKEHELTPAEQCEIQLKTLQVAIEEGIHEGSKAKVAVLGIVDASVIARTAEGDAPAEKKKDKSDSDGPAAALARERKVRDALLASLVQNRLMEMLQPDEATIALAREDMLAANSAALSIEKSRELGEKLGAGYLAGAIVDAEGKSVSVAVQRVEDGVVVFQDVLLDWPAVFGEAEAAAEGAEAEKK
ncbi:hypothetical protein IT575_06935 [bacterium]|nr:hypothetical protein [bacterium]